MAQTGTATELSGASRVRRITPARVPQFAARHLPLARVQNDLFNLGADLRTPDLENDATAKHPRLRIVAAQVAGLETEIDAMNAPHALEQLPGQGTPGRESAVSRSES